MYDVITLGEPLIRFEPNSQYERLERADLLQMALGGAEINVSAALANIGKLKTAIITKLPQNPLGRWVENYLVSYNVSTDFIAHGGTRVGSYYSEQGSRPRTSSVTYDRMHSSFAESSIDDYNLNYCNHAKIFHTTGITLALNENTRDLAFEIAKSFKKAGVLISFDVNYRSTLWSEKKARETIEKFLPLVDILFVSEETCRRMLQRTGSHEEILKDLSKTYNIKIIASTQRTIVNQAHHKLRSIIYDSYIDAFLKTVNEYDIEVVDRVGSGDAYIAGVLYGLLKSDFNCKIAQDYGDAFSALKCTIPGDILISNKLEIESLIKKHNAGLNEDIIR